MPDDDRPALRRRLLAQRERFAAGPGAADAALRLARALDHVLRQLEPECLGSYTPVRGEFTPSMLSFAAPGLALPFARREPREMHYRRWDGREPRAVDECGIASSDGEPVVPDVVLVPCVGFTGTLHRIGYGGGYFDRWLAAHPHVVAVGVAWSASRVEEAVMQPHDHALTVVVTEDGVVG